MAEITEQELMARALRAYWMAARKDEKETGTSWPIPSERLGGVEEIGGKSYATLQNADGILAVYRVRNDGVLKSLKRWPKELEPLPFGGAPAGAATITRAERTAPRIPESLMSNPSATCR